MNQFELLQITQSLKPGQAIDIDRGEFLEAVSGELSGWDRMEPPRAIDIQAFIAKISRNWDVIITLDFVKDFYTLQKPQRPKMFRSMESIGEVVEMDLSNVNLKFDPDPTQAYKQFLKEIGQESHIRGKLGELIISRKLLSYLHSRWAAELREQGKSETEISELIRRDTEHYDIYEIDGCDE